MCSGGKNGKLILYQCLYVHAHVCWWALPKAQIPHATLAYVSAPPGPPQLKSMDAPLFAHC